MREVMATKANTKKAASAVPTSVATVAAKKAHAPRVTPDATNTVAKPSARKAAAAPGASKIDMLVQMMRAKRGASIDQLSKATGWQNHSVRGAISGNIKKKLGLNVTSAAVNGVRVYRIVK